MRRLEDLGAFPISTNGELTPLFLVSLQTCPKASQIEDWTVVSVVWKQHLMSFQPTIDSDEVAQLAFVFPF